MLAKHILLVILSCSLQFCLGQDTTMQKRFKDLRNIIQKNIPYTESSYTSTPTEFFIIDIKLDNKADTITNIDFLRKEKSEHYSFVQTVVNKIKESWKPGKPNLERILIPLIIGFDSNNNEFDYPIPLKNDIEHNVFVTPAVLAAVFGIKR
ncbi:MAG: hypothetical protein WDO71_28465 [Bacteroidota bacterium]